MLRGSQKLVLLALFELALGTAGHAATSLPLLPEARVAGDVIYLSDLLPPQASSEFRIAATKIRLGASPRLGASLTLAADTVAAVLPVATRNEVSLPSQIVVHRFARLITQSEVIAAMNAALQSNSFPGRPRVDAGEVHYSAQIKVAADDARLHVRRIDFDSALQEARFLLVPAADPRALPFLVTARLLSDAAPGISNLEGSAITSLSTPSTDSSRALGAEKKADILIASGASARLHVASGSMQMFLDVIALESGALHQTVRVRIPGNNRVLRGQVVAPGHLEAEF